ncbi:hypothetical protein IV203_013440 [Nitzschia inconspicua]|uniref:Uncharacterized protein n=1 Tax=Nitzschia inconspicua TaxID=303405 RepID=A0A9K3M5X2_9STRA|nr:hypothetical protein IV203_013440 [Nitzschia inconspicua]
MSDSAADSRKGSSLPPSAPPSAAQPSYTSATNTASNSSHEERLSRTWKTMGTAAIQMLSKSEKAVASQLQAQQEQQRHQQSPDLASLQAATKENYKQLDECVVTFLKARIEFLRLLNHIEAKIQGKAEEMESLETYIQMEPRIGGIKRKHTDMETQPTTVDATLRIDGADPSTH